MQRRLSITLAHAVVAGQVLVAAAAASAGERAQATDGTAKGALTFGGATIVLTRAYVFPDPDAANPAGQGFRILVTDLPLTPAAIGFAAGAGSNDADRQELAVELADRSIRGIEVVVSADRRVTRTNVYTADTAMGLMLLQPTEFTATGADAGRLAGRLFTSAPIQDARVGRSIRYDVTFTAPVHAGARK
jgi:hypothetical protein